MKKGIMYLLSGVAGAAAAGITVGEKEKKKTARQKELADKHLLIMKDMNQWLTLKQKGITLKPYFDKHGYKKVAIYGMSFLGERLLDDLKAIGIEVAYGVDKNALNIYSEIDVITPDKTMEPVDAVIVTSSYYFETIEEELEEKVDWDIVSLEDILYESEE